MEKTQPSQAPNGDDGRPGDHAHNRDAFAPASGRRTYACFGSSAAEFGPRALKAVRQDMLTRDWSRRYANKQVGRIKQMFKWAVAEELVPPSVYHGLQAVAGLKRGRSSARETDAVQPVADGLIEPTKRFVSKQVAAMIDLQLLTGARPGEIVIMRPCDIDKCGPVWTYRPSEHKTQHHGHERVIFIGPKAQAVLNPYLLRPPEAYCFSPAQAERQRRDARHEQRVTPLSCGNGPGTNRQDAPRKKPGEHYRTQSYGRAISQGCLKAFPLPGPLAILDGETDEQWTARLGEAGMGQVREWRKAHHWHPHQLRHNYATMVRREYGLEAAQVLLGHSTADVTQVYAERDMDRATEVARKIG